MAATKDYVLGTHNDEVDRLGLQHSVWRQRTLETWRSAGIGPGHVALDVGCGPGYASLDLADLVTSSGRVVAIDKSARFLQTLDETCSARNIRNVTTCLADLDAGEFPDVVADRAWCRWVLSFVRNPRSVLSGMAATLSPGGVLAVLEYFDYSTWRGAPPCPELEEFVSVVMSSWRDQGGEPDIALRLPAWLEELGFEIRLARPIVDVVHVDQPSWQWLATFVRVGRDRLVDLGYLSPVRSQAIWQAFVAFQETPGARMITPAVLEIVAARR